MLAEGIIEESSSPWMAPAVYTKKKTGEIRLCVDYHALNKNTTKDAYPLPLPDEAQDRLSGLPFFPCWICILDTGSFQSIPVIDSFLPWPRSRIV